MLKESSEHGILHLRKLGEKKFAPPKTKQSGEAYSYVQEFSPLDQEQPVRLTTYTMPQIEFYKELEMRIPIR